MTLAFLPTLVRIFVLLQLSQGLSIFICVGRRLANIVTYISISISRMEKLTGCRPRNIKKY